MAGHFQVRHKGLRARRNVLYSVRDGAFSRLCVVDCDYPVSCYELSGRWKVEWVGAASDRVAALSQIESIRPARSSLRWEEGSDASAEALEILAASSADMRVIRLSLADNELKIYHREQRTVG